MEIKPLQTTMSLFWEMIKNLTFKDMQLYISWEEFSQD